MLDVCLLGTGGMMPLPYRWLTSLMMRYNGKSILIDCGEGTQIALKEKGWSPKPIDIICFTHYHADHISGLPGMLLTMGNAERTEPLLLIGPKGLQRIVNALRCIAPELPFEIRFAEITEQEGQIKRLQTAMAELKEARRQDDEFVSYFERYGNIDRLDRETLERLLDYVSVEDAANVHIYFKFSPERKKPLDFVRTIEDMGESSVCQRTFGENS